MTVTDICNLALAIVGQSRKITSLEERSPEAEACKLLFQPTLDICLESCNWSFARKDEIIDAENLLPDVVVLPYTHAYELPSDVMRVLYLQGIKRSPYIETMGERNAIQFNFRNYDGKKVLATNHNIPFAVHYQCYITDPQICSPSFCDALSYVLASKLANTLIRGVEGITVGQTLLQTGQARLMQAASFDAQQGNYSIDNFKVSSFIRART